MLCLMSSNDKLMQPTNTNRWIWRKSNTVDLRALLRLDEESKCVNSGLFIRLRTELVLNRELNATMLLMAEAT